MSYSPSLSVVRLQELKLWQGSYENLLQKSKSNSQTSEIEPLEGIGFLDASNASEGEYRNSRDWDKKEIVPLKPFEQLLEEKLAEDTPTKGNAKPKRPFLRKGQGLARFRMGPTPPVVTRTKVVSPRKIEGNPKTMPNPLSKKAPPITRKGILKKHVFSNNHNHQYVDLSPLTLPDYVKPRGTWKNVFENRDNGQFEVGFHRNKGDNVERDHGEMENYEEFRKSLGGGETVPKIVGGGSEPMEKECVSKKSGNKQISLETPKCRDDVPSRKQKNLSQSSFDEFTKKLLSKISDMHCHPAKQFVGNDIPENISEFLLQKQKNGDLTLYEQKMERELRNFEILEKKVENSSFCSTNTSVTNLLASTPQKLGDNTNKPGDKGILNNNAQLLNTIEFTNDRHENIQLKLHEVAQKTDVLQQFLENLRNVKQNKDLQHENSELSRQSEKSTSTDTSFSDENTQWSTRSPSLTDNCTEYDMTCQSDSWKKIDAGVNTSFDNSRLDETVKNEGACRECEELRSKVSEIKQKCFNFHAENSNLRGDVRELEKKIEQLKKDMKKAKEKYEETVESLQGDLDCEKKKFAKEKFYFETYVKESQNKASKKEREEITQLKQDLIDAKELLKLKEAKNGATQARLRTQIRQQEKDISGLKSTVDKLQRENAKLSANQKFMRRPQEVKMLHEINKNLSKLTEETFKKISGNDSQENVKIERKKSSEMYDMESDVGKENLKSGKNVGNNKGVQKNVSSKDSFRADSVSFDSINSESLSLEKQYEHVFGNLASPRNSTNSTSLDKTEKTLADGSMEVTYSNGNFKVISADGQYIKMKYFNGDVKITDLKEKIIRYHYATTDSWHIQYPDGTEVMEYKDGQTCKKHTDGKTEVCYPDGTVRIINPDGTEEQRFPDGRKSLKNIQGEQIIYLPNGQREIHTEEYKRREYPDGTIRTLHKDGSVETIYANGRVRLKDSSGALIMDTHQS